ncbi:Aste57867_16731 [Aphanomyces stellatus]|uniref:Aste57867_16731 protein n=1 Tax=Aphanomyces stellatus TaxID=120398 RepID=A0A485L7P8_9STRA|nr:hypothetical protein As57867_016674 [Aphanomyces stellatus]VFT93500.1 Aste57867_16731 [Aphanomyces stellatus]
MTTLLFISISTKPNNIKRDKIFNSSIKLQCAYLKQLITSIQALHSLGYIHGDIKLENFVLFNYDQFKVIDFECAELIDTDIKTPHFTREYYPPEMANFFLNYKLNPEVTSLKASTALDVWSAAVLVLHLFSRRGSLVEFEDIENEDNIPRQLTSPKFSFRKSIHNTHFAKSKRETREKCLCIDRAKRGTLDEILSLIPQLTQRSYDFRISVAASTEAA